MPGCDAVYSFNTTLLPMFHNSSIHVPKDFMFPTLREFVHITENKLWLAPVTHIPGLGRGWIATQIK